MNRDKSFEKEQRPFGKAILLIAILFAIQLTACAPAQSEITATAPIAIAETPTVTATLVSATATPTPADTATPTGTPTPTATNTPAPTPTEAAATAETITPELLEKWQSLGFIEDYRNNGEQLVTTQTALDNYDKFLEYFAAHPDEFDALYGSELRDQLLNPDAANRQGLSWRVGFTEIMVDESIVNASFEFGFGGTKQSGETIVPNTKLKNTYEILEKYGASVHAINLGILDRDKYDPDWYQKYLKYIKENPNANYELKGSVPFPDKPGSFEMKSLGTVDATLPVKIVVLPSVMDKNKINGVVGQAIGSDPRAPFGMSYLDRDGGYFSIKVTNGKITVYTSNFTNNHQYLGSKKDYGNSSLMNILKAERNPSYFSVITSSYGTDKSVIELYKLLYEDPGNWEKTFLILK